MKTITHKGEVLTYTSGAGWFFRRDPIGRVYAAKVLANWRRNKHLYDNVLIESFKHFTQVRFERKLPR